MYDADRGGTVPIEAGEPVVLDAGQHLGALAQGQALHVPDDVAGAADREHDDVREMDLEDLLLHAIPPADALVEHIAVVREQLPAIGAEAVRRLHGRDEVHQGLAVAEGDRVGLPVHHPVTLDDDVAEQLLRDLDEERVHLGEGLADDGGLGRQVGGVVVGAGRAHVAPPFEACLGISLGEHRHDALVARSGVAIRHAAGVAVELLVRGDLTPDEVVVRGLVEVHECVAEPDAHGLSPVCVLVWYELGRYLPSPHGVDNTKATQKPLICQRFLRILAIFIDI